MAAPKRDNERAARLLVEAMLHGDVTAAEQAGVTRQTVYRYRKALLEDPELLQLFTEYSKELLKRDWADALDSALAQNIVQLSLHMASLPLGTPASLEALTEAFRALSETAITREVLRAGDGE